MPTQACAAAARRSFPMRFRTASFFPPLHVRTCARVCLGGTLRESSCQAGKAPNSDRPSIIGTDTVWYKMQSHLYITYSFASRGRYCDICMMFDICTMYCIVHTDCIFPRSKRRVQRGNNRSEKPNGKMRRASFRTSHVIQYGEVLRISPNSHVNEGDHINTIPEPFLPSSILILHFAAGDGASSTYISL